MANKYYTLRDWPIAIEANDEIDALRKFAEAVCDISDRIKAGEKVNSLFTARVVEIDETSKGRRIVVNERPSDAEKLIPSLQLTVPEKKGGWNVN
jgi:hypothetical protein